MTAKNPRTSHQSGHAVTVSEGELLPTSRQGLFIVKVGGKTVSSAPSDQVALPLLRKVGRALAKPGVSRTTVFGHAPSKKFYAYSLDPTDPRRMVREDADGNKTVGHMVNGSFRKRVPAA